MSSRRHAISPVRRNGDQATSNAVGSESTSCPVCGVDLNGVSFDARSRHAATCAETLSQLDHVTQEDGNDEYDDDLIALVDEIDRKRELEAAKKASRATTSGSASAIQSGETVERWLHRIGYAPYFHPLYVKEELLDVEIAKECSAMDLMSVGVDAEDARALAHCGGAPPDTISNVPQSTTVPSAMQRAREIAASNDDSLWAVARGAENRGRGESLPSIERFTRAKTTER
jgi:hypothetical protein